MVCTREEHMLEIREVGDGEATRDSRKPAWEAAHDELVRMARTRSRLDRAEGHWLLVAAREGTHARLGYGSFVEYVERLFGYSPRWTIEKLRVAEALEALPVTRRALEEGSLNWSIARELTRVATADTETEWLATAARKTAREVERLVSGHAPGTRPNDAPDARFQRHVIRLEVSGESFALFREAMAKLRQEAAEPLDDDGAVLLLARRVLGGPSDEGRASYQVSLSVCEHCRRGFQRGNGEQVEVLREVLEMAACDEQDIGSSRPVENSTHVGTGPRKAGAGSESLQRLQVRSSARAAQTVPPSIRRRVLARDGRCCVVPGCRHAVFVDVHHLERRADGGKHALENLVTLCGAHHRAVHRGALSISRHPDGELRFRHGDGSNYGEVSVSPRAAATRTKAFQALRTLGFREGESKRAVERAVGHAESENVEDLLRRALRELDRPA
jgi:hypothetical protein